MKETPLVAFVATFLFFFGALAMPALAQPTADYLRVGDGYGESGTYVEVPVTISNLHHGPVQGIRLRVEYHEDILYVTSITKGDLTASWTSLLLGADGHTLTVATADTGDAISSGSSGTIVLLTFYVRGSPGDISPLNLALRELANPDGQVGTAPPQNGTFTVLASGVPTPTPTPSPTPTPGGGGGGGGSVLVTPLPTATPTPAATASTPGPTTSATPALPAGSPTPAATGPAPYNPSITPSSSPLAPAASPSLPPAEIRGARWFWAVIVSVILLVGLLGYRVLHGRSGRRS